MVNVSRSITRSPSHAAVAGLFCMALSGCNVLPRAAADAKDLDVIDGFRVFAGPCTSGTSDRSFSTVLAPLVGNLVGSLFKAGGAALKAQGTDKSELFTGTVNVDSLKPADYPDCIYMVHGPVFTNASAFDASKLSLQTLLPIDWERRAASDAIPGRTPEANLDRVTAAARAAMRDSGVRLAGRPRLYVELRVVRMPDGSSPGFALRLRTLYYGAALIPGGGEKRHVTIAAGLFDASKAATVEDAQKYAIVFRDVAVGTSTVFDDVLAPKAEAVRAWETPWLVLDAARSAAPATLLGMVTETRPGHPIAAAVGGAIESSADGLAKAIADKLAERPADNAEAKTKEDAARTAAASASQVALTDWEAAWTAHERCRQTNQSAATPAEVALAVAFQKARVKAVVSLANAEPLVSGIAVDRTFLESPAVGCTLAAG